MPLPHFQCLSFLVHVLPLVIVPQLNSAQIMGLQLGSNVRQHPERGHARFACPAKIAIAERFRDRVVLLQLLADCFNRIAHSGA